MRRINASHHCGGGESGISNFCAKNGFFLKKFDKEIFPLLLLLNRFAM
jgi:hypothetical protein